VAVVVVGGAAAAAIVLHPFSHNENLASTGSTLTPSASRSAPPGKATASSATAPSSAASSSAGASSSATTTATAVTEQGAATSVAGMLTRSGSDRTAITNAVNDVNSCGPSLAGDPKVFEQAASSRQSLLGSLASMPGRGTLPAALITDLTNAWQASVAADNDFVRWADDEIAKGCVANDTSDPGYQAATTPDNEATAAKQAFVAQWNPIAGRYGLSQYQWNQL
jgi:hypothetical protein